MTRANQKATEEKYVKAFLNDFNNFSSLEGGEGPDFWVRQDGSPDIALEVTEYHPAAEGLPGVRRSEVEGRWDRELEPTLDRLRRERPALGTLQAHIDFNDHRLPKRREHPRLATEIIAIAETVAPRLCRIGEEIEIIFLPRRLVYQLSRWDEEEERLAEEDWPFASTHLNSLSFCVWPELNWPPWRCPRINGAWFAPSVEHFRLIVTGKTSKAVKYTLNGAPPWLLIVCEVPGDVQSHIFPTDAAKRRHLHETIRDTGYDFGNGPFSQVWLFSAFSGSRLQLFPFVDEGYVA